MKRLLVPVSLLAICVLFGACEPSRQPKTKTRTLPPPPPPPTHVDDSDSTDPSGTTQPKPTNVEPPVQNVVPEPPKTVGEVPYGRTVPGKPGFVTSPYGNPGYIDVRGFPPGTEVKDPYSGKTFLVP
jgi:hypothetical protein